MTFALIVTLFVVFVRNERYGRVSGTLLMLAGLLAIGGAEWVREDLRKPWVIGQHMFVNGVRLPPRDAAPKPPEGFPADRYTVEALNASGVLAASPWARLPAGYTPGALTAEAMDPKKLIELEAAAGREVFRLQCFACHSVDRYNGIDKLVKGKSSSTIEGILGRLARPVNAKGEAAAWTDPQLALKTWRDRMMPPFVGTAAEAHALSVYLATLGRRRGRGGGGAGDGAAVRREALRGQLRDVPRAGERLPDGQLPEGPGRRCVLRGDRPPSRAQRADAPLRGDRRGAASPCGVPCGPRPAGRRAVGEETTMNPVLLAAIPQLDPIPLAAPAALMWFLLILTFFLHLLPMNFVLGGSLIALLARDARPPAPAASTRASWCATSPSRCRSRWRRR